MEGSLDAVKETHTDKDGNVVLLYTPDRRAAAMSPPVRPATRCSTSRAP